MLSRGDRFSTTSPLLPEAKKFLQQFCDSSGERVLADRAMNDDQIAIAHAQSRAVSVVVEERKKNAARRALQEEWSRQFTVSRIKSLRAGWWQVAGGLAPKGTRLVRPPSGWPEEPPAWDHAELWGRGGKPFVAVSQPYPWLLNRDLDLFNDFAAEYGLRFRISNYPAWYFPGRCWFVEWFRDDSAERD